MIVPHPRQHGPRSRSFPLSERTVAVYAIPFNQKIAAPAQATIRPATAPTPIWNADETRSARAALVLFAFALPALVVVPLDLPPPDALLPALDPDEASCDTMTVDPGNWVFASSDCVSMAPDPIMII